MRRALQMCSQQSLESNPGIAPGAIFNRTDTLVVPAQGPVIPERGSVSGDSVDRQAGRTPASHRHPLQPHGDHPAQMETLKHRYSEK